MKRIASIVPGRRTQAKLAMVLLAGIAGSVFTVVSASATSVNKLVLSPNPIGTVNNVAPGTTVPVTMTAQSCVGTTCTPVGGVAVFLAFLQAPSGGTAFVGTTALQSHFQSFTTDTGGHVTITYSTPGSYPAGSTGVDVIKAQNGPTVATSTVKTSDSFAYSNISALAFTPTPIALQGRLGPHSSRIVTLTVFGPGSQRLANSPVYVAFKQGLGGGSATVGAVTLGSAPIQLMTNGSGQIFITYSTPLTLPPTGVADRLVASDATKFGAVNAADAYRY